MRKQAIGGEVIVWIIILLLIGFAVYYFVLGGNKGTEIDTGKDYDNIMAGGVLFGLTDMDEIILYSCNQGYCYQIDKKASHYKRSENNTLICICK